MVRGIKKSIVFLFGCITVAGIVIGTFFIWDAGEVIGAWDGNEEHPFNDWENRFLITSDSTLVENSNGNLYYDLSLAPQEFWNSVKEDGGDIRVTQADGETEVAREVSDLSVSTEEGSLFFDSAGLSSSGDTDWYVYYGNSVAEEPDPGAVNGSQNVWNNDYVGVWHKNDVLVDLPEQQIGIETPSGGYHSGDYGLHFSASGDITLTTATIDAESSGTTTILLHKFDPSTQNPQDGPLVDSVELGGLSAGTNTVTLNLQTDGPGDYWVGRTDGFSMLRSDDGQNFPFNSDPTGVSFLDGREFDGGNTADRWYYLFDLNIEGEVTQMVDATNNDNAFAQFGDLAEVDGVLGSARSYNGSGEYVQAESAPSISDAVSGGTIAVSWWVRPANVGSDKVHTSFSVDGSNRFYIRELNSSGDARAWVEGGGSSEGHDMDAVFSQDEWQHFTWVIENGNEHTLYKNGAVFESWTHSVSITALSGSPTFEFGIHPHFGSSFEGSADEIRFSSTVRSLGWVETEYNNQNDPNAFWTTGSQEEKPESSPNQFYWTAEDHSINDVPSEWTDDASITSYSIQEDGDGIKHLLIDASDNSRSFLRYTPVDGSDPDTEEVEIYAKLVIDDDAGDVWTHSRGTSTTDTQNVSAVRFDRVPNLEEDRLSEYFNGDFTDLVSQNMTGSLGDVVHIRFRATGDTLEGRAWLDGDPEPETWDLSVTTNVLGPGSVGVGHWRGDNFKIYEFGVGIGGAEAPTGIDDDEEETLMEIHGDVEIHGDIEVR